MLVVRSSRGIEVGLAIANILSKVYSKVIKYVNWLINVRFEFSVPKESDIVIFEDTNTDYLLPLCGNFSYKILDTNLTNPSICLATIANTLKFLLFGNSIKSSYCSAII